MPEITALGHAAQLGRLGEVTLTWGFYRQPNGWITVSPATDIEELKYRREGWKPLPEYGRVEMVTEYAVDHPLEVLFMQGGAKELPIDQIIEMGFHLNPPVVPGCGRRLDQFHKRHRESCWANAQTISFPQLNGEHPGFQCRFCSRAPFPTEAAREQHEGVMHKEEKSDIRTGEALAGSLVTGLKGAGAVRVGAEPGASVTKPYVCGFCGEGFSHPLRLGKHIKECPKNEHKEDISGDDKATAEDGAPAEDGE